YTGPLRLTSAAGWHRPYSSHYLAFSPALLRVQALLRQSQVVLPRSPLGPVPPSPALHQLFPASPARPLPVAPRLSTLHPHRPLPPGRPHRPRLRHTTLVRPHRGAGRPALAD